MNAHTCQVLHRISKSLIAKNGNAVSSSSFTKTTFTGTTTWYRFAQTNDEPTCTATTTTFEENECKHTPIAKTNYNLFIMQNITANENHTGLWKTIRIEPGTGMIEVDGKGNENFTAKTTKVEGSFRIKNMVIETLEMNGTATNTRIVEGEKTRINKITTTTEEGMMFLIG